jgi:hypothetical protein
MAVAHMVERDRRHTGEGLVTDTGERPGEIPLFTRDGRRSGREVRSRSDDVPVTLAAGPAVAAGGPWSVPP